MKRLLSALVMLSVATALFGCGKQESAEVAQPAAQTQAPGSAETKPADTPAPGPDTTAEPATSAEGEAQPETPAAQVSETADEEQTPPVADASTQPSLRLGGPANEPAASGRFKEGTHYRRIVPVQRTDVAGDKVEVMEVFWYGCPHCYALDGAVENWRRQSKPGFVEFTRVPVMWGNIHRTHARAFYTAELLGKLDQLHSKIFRAVQVEHNALDTPEKVRAFFVAQGVSEADFRRAYSSFAVENKLRRAELIGRGYRIDAVPMFTVNGKYVTGLSDAGGEAQLFALLNELATAEHGSR